MHIYAIVVFLFSLLSAHCKKVKDESAEENELAHGFGDDIHWVPWSDAVAHAKASNKPVFLIIHKSWCGACQALKTTFKVSTKRKEFVALSKKFVMVNTEDDDEPEEETYAPDGRYVPRIFFLDTEGERIKGIDNKKHYPTNKFYFAQIPDLISAMKKALKAFEKKADEKEPEDAELQKTKPEDDEEKEEDEKTEEAAKCPFASKKAKKEKEKMEKKVKEEKVTDERKEVKKSKDKKKEKKADEKEEGFAEQTKEDTEKSEESEKPEKETKKKKTIDKKAEKKEKKEKESQSKGTKESKTEL